MEHPCLLDPGNATRPECLAAAALYEMTRYVRSDCRRAAAAAAVFLDALARHPALKALDVADFAEQMSETWQDIAHEQGARPGDAAPSLFSAALMALPSDTSH